MNGVWNDGKDAELKKWWATGMPINKIAAAMQITRGSVDGRSRVLNLHRPPKGGSAVGADHPAIVNGRTIFPSQVVHVSTLSFRRDMANWILKSGDNNRKLGRDVTKGRWRPGPGKPPVPIFSLTLEERATCPRTCEQWRNCYGNNMFQAVRYMQGRELEHRLDHELSQLQELHPDGFVVRLHALGDFYSLDYVKRWSVWLDAYPALRVFGYTHYRRGTEIGDAIRKLRDARWDRFAVRTSDAPSGPRTMVVDQIMGKLHPDPADHGATMCPAQTGKTASCGTCGLCWQSRGPIGFMRH